MHNLSILITESIKKKFLLEYNYSRMSSNSWKCVREKTIASFHSEKHHITKKTNKKQQNPGNLNLYQSK